MRRQWEPGWWRRGGVTSAFLIVGVVLATRSRANVWHCVRVAPVGVRLRTDAVRCMCGRVYHVCAVFPAGFCEPWCGFTRMCAISGVPVCKRHAETE